MAETWGADHSGEVFIEGSFRGATIRESDLTGLRIVGSWVEGLSIETFAGELDGALYVDGVDVAPYVTAELDRRFPERGPAREAVSAREIQDAWSAIQQAWEHTLARAATLDEEVLDASVNGEFSFLQTLRHLVLALDTWVGHMLDDPPSDWHPWGQPFTGLPPEAVAEMGLDVDAAPTLAEVTDVLRGRWARLDAHVAALTDDSLDDVISAQADPERFVTETRRHCVKVLLNEHTEHRRYAVRDLDAMGAGTA